MSKNDSPFVTLAGSIAVDISGNEFGLDSVGPAFVYPLAKTLMQAQHLHSLFMRAYMHQAAGYNSDSRVRAEENYQRALEIIVLANRIEGQ